MAEVLKIVGGIAGIGGLSLGVLLLLYRDIIGRKVFPTLSSAHATMLLGSIVVLTFAVAILGMFAGLAAGSGAVPFITLVVILLGFIVAVLLIGVRFVSTRRPTGPVAPTEGGKFFTVSNLIEASRLNDADRELSRSAGDYQGTAEFWYWRSRVALARGNVDVATSYVDEALKRNDRDEHSLALRIKLLLLSPKRGDRAKARAQVEQSYGISGTLDAWLTQLKAEGILEPGVRSNTELDTKCPLPDHVWSTDVTRT